MKKIFLVAGEVSGDLVGAWYLNKVTPRYTPSGRTRGDRDVSRAGHSLQGDGWKERGQEKQENVHAVAVGGDALKKAGAHIFMPMTDLNVAGIFEIIKHIPRLLRIIKKIAQHIATNNYDEIILVDFPGFNLRLAKAIKKHNSQQKIVYLSPPQLCAWGAGHVKQLKAYCNEIIVLYPFEVAWYEKHGVKVRFIGSPQYDRLQPYFSLTEKKENKIAFLPASRESECKKILPVMLEVMKQFSRVFPQVKLVLALAPSISRGFIENKLRKAGFLRWGKDVHIVQNEKEKLRELATCCLAVTKPGTSALELALLQVPSLVIYKTSWLTYLIARSLVNISQMALPNLMLKKIVFPEFIQAQCRPHLILKEMRIYYEAFCSDDDLYKRKLEHVGQIRKILSTRSL